MAKKRMFSQDVINNDTFLEMPDSSQNLYFHLSMQADDDGFISNYKSLMRMLGKKEDDLKVLIAKQFIIPFKNGILVIKHWRLNNYIQKDRYTETIYKDEKAQLSTDNNNVYSLYTDCIHSIDKIRLDKIREDKNIEPKIPMLILGEYENVKLTEFEYEMLVLEYRKKATDEIIEELSSGIKSKGYKYKDHNATIRNWLRRKGVEKCQEVDKTKMKKIYLENMEQKKKQIGETE